MNRMKNLGALDFLKARSLAAKSAEVEELRAANTGATNLLDLIDDLGVKGEDTLDALAEAHLANGKAALRSVIAGNHDTFKCLEALFIAFLDLDLHAHCVAGDERRQVCAVQLVGKALHDWMDRHCSFLQLISELLVYMKLRVSAGVRCAFHATKTESSDGGKLFTSRHYARVSDCCS